MKKTREGSGVKRRYKKEKQSSKTSQIIQSFPLYIFYTIIPNKVGIGNMVFLTLNVNQSTLRFTNYETRDKTIVDFHVA